MALQKQTIEIPLGVGVETKIDPKIVQPGALLALENGEFSKTGAVSKRKGYDALSKSIVSGGSVNGGARVFAAGDTLTAIASVDGVKSYYQHIKQANKWASMGNAYPGVVRTRRLARDANVSSNNIDVAVCNNYALFAWIQGSAAHHCLVDTSTNTTIWASTVSGASSGPRVTASGKYIYMVHAVGANVLLYALDTTSLPTVTAFNTPAATLQTDFSSSGTSRQVEVGSLGGGTAVLVYRTSTPSVKVQRFDQSGTIATSLAVAESAVSAIGLVVSAAGDCYVAYRQAATGDLRCFAATSAMGALFAVTTIDTDATIGVPCGVETTTANTIQWVWSITVTTATYQRVRKAQINNAGTVTSAAAVAFYGVSAASQPFVRKGRMYIMTSYNYPYYGAPIAQASQASYFLMDLGNSNATSAATAGRILPGNGSVSAGVTAGVWYVPTKVGVLSNGRVLTGAVAAYNESQFVDTIAFAMNRVELPVAVELDFDAPPRTAEINESVFVTGMAGQTIGPGTVAGQNFQLFPEIISTTGGTSGSMSDGTYQVAAVFARVDDDGTVTFSAPSIPASVALSGGGVNQSISVVVSGLKHELADFVLVYCTAASGSVFYENTRVAISACADTATATIITTNANLRILYTDGGVLENGAPPCFTSVIRKGRRLYGVTPDAKLCYTKEVVAGESPAFVEETLVKNLQQDGGETYELAEMDGAIVVLGERSIQALSGDGMNETGSSDTLSEPRSIPVGAGLVPGSPVLSTDMGVWFKSPKGLSLLTRSFQVDDDIGRPVESYNALALVSIVVVPDKDQIRFGHSDGPTLVYHPNTSKKLGEHTWSVFTNLEQADAMLWDGKYSALKGSGVVWRESGGFVDGDNKPITMVIDTPWIKLSGIQGFQRLYGSSLIGDFKSPHTLKWTTYYDYKNDKPLVKSKAIKGSAGAPLQFRRHSGRKCQAVRMRIEDAGQQGTGESCSLTALAVELGGKGGIFRQGAAKTI